MSFSQPTKLGIVACPGGEQFADEIITNLKSIYYRRFEKKTRNISKVYGVTEEEAVKHLNYDNDLSSTQVKIYGNPDKYRVPSFKVPGTFTRFANGELKAEIKHSVKGMDIYIVQDVENAEPIQFSTGEPVQCSINDHIFNLLVTIDAVKQSGARSITVVAPVYPYSRQHKKKGREGLTASSLGRILEGAGVCRIITLDIHSKEIEHTFKELSLVNLHASYQVLRKLSNIMDLHNEDMVVVSPDTGAIDRNKYFASSLQKPLALLYKERDYSKVTESASESNITSARLLGDVNGKNVFMADDMLGTGGTMIKAMGLLKDNGAKKIVCAVSLPLFTGKAIEYFDQAYAEGKFYRIIGTNAVTKSIELLEREWYVCANVSNLFARSISRLHHNRSMSPILDNSKMIQRMLSQSKKKENN
ncbi:MAG: ribose-phosphate diphosphokinase [Spirochaetales bacterium]|nr:ribose-phosphate diphosphokinase [Spirochaetales bacterium]